MTAINYRGINKRLSDFGIHNPLEKVEEKKMVFEKKEDVIKGDRPDFKGDGIAIWVKKDKNGKEYLSCCILGNINIPAWKYEPKQ